MPTKGKLESTNQPNPLASVHGKPMIGMEMPGLRYLGRVIIELYETTDKVEPDDRNLVTSVDTAQDVNISSKTLLQRVASAISTQVAKTTK
ncbi:hypothetical protein EPA93_44270 [Ktedonosporobacter rubrisoli]|uniref:Uncharacterized protein n=1 Tax=Ktedonosporobacter rubrisoli TaxID=2509675 RepID=A0A4P6K3S3_KTERU|nr:hypothetical protein [Ktedonosporobacter rubrisoli]QBD82612.1 hypothetical protein EPA93_44270 [Ktedonosporobacter rubrisoli]